MPAEGDGKRMATDWNPMWGKRFGQLDPRRREEVESLRLSSSQEPSVENLEGREVNIGGVLELKV